jgi:riboflavin kinase/FMN adenylyltransferase
LQQDAREFRILTSLEEKKALLAAAGIDRVEVLPFTRKFAAMTALEYLQLLRDKYDASLVVMGYDNRIGSDKLTASEIGVSQAVAPRPLPTSLRSVGPLPFTWPRAAMVSGDPNAPVISSTKIRNALQEGRVEEANAMLGYRYGLYGAVVAGNQLGRTMGFPTANMQLYEPLKLVPANGVYAVEAEVLGTTYKGMCNIGMRPTVGGASRTIETHILDFDQDIYGLPLRIRFLRRIRDERKFPSLEALRKQLTLDALNCKK